jgi:hypothetical protein
MLKRFLYCLPVLVCLTAALGQRPTETKLPPPSPAPPEHPAAESVPTAPTTRTAGSAVVIPTKPGTGVAPCDCCAKKPKYTSAAWAPFTGQIAIVTQKNDSYGVPLSDHVVVIWNLTGESTAPVNTWWGTPATQYYSDPGWTYQNMGEVFGLSLDNVGNIYAASTSIYGTTASGTIYRITNGTGAVSSFASLPNNSNGLGNLAWDCGSSSLYASDFYDGLIYQLSSTGTVLSTWDHGANLPTATPSRPAIATAAKDGSSSYAALGRRPWAVHVYKSRLYYSVWDQDMGRPTGAGPNEIWSVGLAANGNPTGSARLEITMPVLAGHAYSNPVADITFTVMGTMLVTERSMGGNNSSSAHASRALEFSPSGSGWMPSAALYAVGAIGSPPTNSAGGIDFDFTPGARFPVWASGDALHFSSADFVYGIQGFPPGGGAVANSLLIDDSNYIANSNKTQIGDVRIPCPDCTNPPPAPIITGPTSMCTSPPNYSVSNPQTGVTYTWTVNGGTPSATTGTSINVNWANTASGSITVTTSSADGCGPVTSTIQVAACTVNSCSYCKDFKTTATLPAPPVAGAGGLQTVSPIITSTMPGVTSITETLLSTTIGYGPGACHASGALASYIPQGLPSTLPAFNPPLLPVPNGNQVIWQSSSATTLPSAGVGTPFQLQLPASTGIPKGCTNANFSFCMSFSLADDKCRNCSVIACFGPFPYENQIGPKSDTTPVTPTVEQPKTSKKKKLLHGLEKAAGTVEVGGGGNGGQGKDTGGAVPK